MHVSDTLSLDLSALSLCVRARPLCRSSALIMGGIVLNVRTKKKWSCSGDRWRLEKVVHVTLLSFAQLLVPFSWMERHSLPLYLCLKVMGTLHLDERQGGHDVDKWPPADEDGLEKKRSCRIQQGFEGTPGVNQIKCKNIVVYLQMILSCIYTDRQTKHALERLCPHRGGWLRTGFKLPRRIKHLMQHNYLSSCRNVFLLDLQENRNQQETRIIKSYCDTVQAKRWADKPIKPETLYKTLMWYWAVM